MSTTELVTLPTPGALAEVRDPTAVMLALVEQAKCLLEQAQGISGIAEVMEHRSRAEAIKVYSEQAGFGKEAQLSAGEIVRRCERRIAQLVRDGQAEGSISREHAAGGQARALHRGEQLHVPVAAVSPNEIVGSRMLTGGEGAYALADDISEEQFEQALTEAKADGNVSRANVVRKLKPKPLPEPKPVPAKPTVRENDLLYRSRRLDSDRIVETAVSAAASLETTAMEHVVWSDLSRDSLDMWITQTGQAIRFLVRLKKNLEKEQANEQIRSNED